MFLTSAVVTSCKQLFVAFLFLRRKWRCSADCSVDPCCCAKFTVLFPCGLSCLSFHVLTITASLLNPQVPSSAEVRPQLPRRGVWITTLALHAFNVENPDANSFGCYWHRWIPGTLWHLLFFFWYLQVYVHIRFPHPSESAFSLSQLPPKRKNGGRCCQGHAGVIYQNARFTKIRWKARSVTSTVISCIFGVSLFGLVSLKVDCCTLFPPIHNFVAESLQRLRC